MRRKVTAVFTIVILSFVVLAAAKYEGNDDDDGAILKFSTMAGVTGPYVGPSNPIRAIPGGNLAWIFGEGHGELKANGQLKLQLRGLGFPVPPFNSTNPFLTRLTMVSC